jgi:hypothetical protein
MHMCVTVPFSIHPSPLLIFFNHFFLSVGPCLCRDVIITSTMMIALITIFVNGGATVAALSYLGIPIGVDPKPYVESVTACVFVCAL